MKFRYKRIFPITLLFLGSQVAHGESLTLVCENGTFERSEKTRVHGKPKEPTFFTSENVDDAVITIDNDECFLQIAKRSGSHPLIEFGETNIICGSTTETIEYGGKFNTSFDFVINRLNGKFVFKTINHYEISNRIWVFSRDNQKNDLVVQEN